MAEFMEQFERTKRSLKKIENQDRDSTDYDDDLWHFFQDCYHLKDWIKNDLSVPEVIKGTKGKKVENYINKNKELQICADLANRSKHLELTDSRNNINAEVTNRNVTIQVPTLHVTLSHDRKNIINSYSDSPGKTTQELIITLSDGTKYNALNVARKAVELWGKYLSDNGLL